MLRHALKEWAVICKALAAGRQTLLLRKGGIAEAAGIFQVEQPRAWLFPTYVHQQDEGVVEEARPLMEEVRKEQPPKGVLRLSLFADIVAVWQLPDLERILRLGDLHLWSEDTIRSRFHYRQPGLDVLVIRVHKVPEVIETVDRPEYAGCRSWVDLGQEFPTEGATPVLDDREFRFELGQVQRLLQPDVVV